MPLANNLHFWSSCLHLSGLQGSLIPETFRAYFMNSISSSSFWPQNLVVPITRSDITRITTMLLLCFGDYDTLLGKVIGADSATTRFLLNCSHEDPEEPISISEGDASLERTGSRMISADEIYNTNEVTSILPALAAGFARQEFRI